MLIVDRSTPLTGDLTGLPRFRHGAGVAGYAHRYMPDDVTTAVGAVTTSWTDYVGGKTLTGTNGPTVRAIGDGRKYLEFDGTNDTIKNESFTVGNLQTVVMVAKGRAADSGTTIYVSGSAISVNRNGTAGTTINPGSPTNNATKLDNTWRCVAVVATASDARLIIDGVKATATPNGTFANILRLAANGTPAFFSQLDVIELIAYPSALTDGQVATVRTAMLAAYPTLLT